MEIIQRNHLEALGTMHQIALIEANRRKSTELKMALHVAYNTIKELDLYDITGFDDLRIKLQSAMYDVDRLQKEVKDMLINK